MKTKKDIKKAIANNGLKIYHNHIPTHIVCNNCGLQTPLDIWLKIHGNNCKLPRLDCSNMT